MSPVAGGTAGYIICTGAAGDCVEDAEGRVRLWVDRDDADHYAELLESEGKPSPRVFPVVYA